MAERKKTFEQGMQRLEEIANLLDRGQVPLEEAMKLYEEGQKTAAELQKILEKAERTVSRAPVETGVPNREEDLEPVQDVENASRNRSGEPTLF